MLTLVVKYSSFAAIATLCNLLAQYLSLRVYAGKFGLFVAICVGTAAGLVVKYVLDKKYIFGHRPQSLRHDFRTFLFYTATGGGTTLIFWGTEFFFHAMIPHPGAKYFGAALGLTIGYIIKYRLDKSLVFGVRHDNL